MNERQIKLEKINDAVKGRMAERGLRFYKAAEIFGRSRGWATQELFADPDKTLRYHFVHQPQATNEFAKMLGWPGAREMLTELGIMDGTGYEDTSSADTRFARTAAITEFTLERNGTTRLAIFKSGAGPVLADSEIDGELDVENDLLAKYPSLVPFRIIGDCMEPDYPNGWVALVVPDPAFADFGSDVLMWFSDDGRAIKRLIESREDGTHVVMQLKPGVGEGKIIQAAQGSVILGVVIDVRRGGKPRVNKRELIAALEAEAPYLLEETR